MVMTSPEKMRSLRSILRPDSVPTNTFTFKADVASSEGANNVELARLYEDTCPFRTAPQKQDSRIRQGIDGFPIVVFWYDGENTSFIGKYNFNFDKATPEVFGFAEGDETWEILNNTSDRVLWKDDDYSGTDWQGDFEARYPKDYADPANLSELGAWLKSTDQSAATGDKLTVNRTFDGVLYTTDTAAYRLAKFKSEFAQHFEKDAVLFYYLFTELFLMVDSRSVHAFIVGEHGDSEIAAWSSANVSGVPLDKFCEMRGHYNHAEATERIAEEVKQVEILRKILDLFRILWLCHGHNSAQLFHIIRGKSIRSLCQCIEVRKAFLFHIQQHIHFIRQLRILHPKPDIRRIRDTRPLKGAVGLLLHHGEVQPCDVLGVLRLGFGGHRNGDGVRLIVVTGEEPAIVNLL